MSSTINWNVKYTRNSSVPLVSWFLCLYFQPRLPYSCKQGDCNRSFIFSFLTNSNQFIVRLPVFDYMNCWLRLSGYLDNAFCVFPQALCAPRTCSQAEKEDLLQHNLWNNTRQWSVSHFGLGRSSFRIPQWWSWVWMHRNARFQRYGTLFVRQPSMQLKRMVEQNDRAHHSLIPRA